MPLYDVLGDGMLHRRQLGRGLWRVWIGGRQEEGAATGAAG
jgi:hypothetical protein